jgi:hypothetical protein
MFNLFRARDRRRLSFRDMASLLEWIGAGASGTRIGFLGSGRTSVVPEWVYF